MSESLGAKLDEMERRLQEIDTKIVDPEVMSQGQVYASLLKERGSLVKVVEPYRAWRAARARLDEAQSILADDESDAELKQLATEELAALEEDAGRLREEVKRAAVTEESAPQCDALIEVRAGTGGDEAALFVGDLVRMYSRYAERRRWKVTRLDARPTDLGGFKEITFSVAGEDAYRRLRFESGGHRVQRVPTTEAQGRIHTSLVTVAVLPDIEDVAVDINPADIRMEFYRASGPGGQKVNKTSSAVRLIHDPTGIEATCQESPSQHKNRAHAMRVLRARIYEQERVKREAERAQERRSLIGSGDRSERIRTYNFPQSRVTDHRAGLTAHNLSEMMDGDLDALMDGLLEHEVAERDKDFDLE